MLLGITDPTVLAVALVCFFLGIWLTVREEMHQHSEHSRLWR